MTAGGWSVELRPAISQKALMLKSALRAHSGAQTAAPPSIVTLALSGGVEAGGRQDASLPDSRLSQSDWVRLVRETPAGARVKVGGLDAITSPHFEAVLFEADRRSLDLEVVTAGIGLEDAAPIAFGLGASTLRVVLFGPEATHNRLAGSPRAFETAARGVLALRGLRCAAARPAIVADVTIAEENRAGIAETVECALSMGADKVVVRHAPPSAVSCPAVSKDSAGSDSQSDEAHAGEDAASTLMKQLAAVRKRTLQGSLKILPELTEEEMRRFYGGEAASMGPKRCLAPWLTVRVGPDGTAAFCTGQSLGSVRDAAIEDVFNCEKARALRRALRHALAPGCCCCAGRFTGGETLL